MSLLTLIHINMFTSCVLTQVIFRKPCWWDITGITSVIPGRHNLLAYSLLLWIFPSLQSSPYIEELSDNAPQKSYRSSKEKRKTNTDIRSRLLTYLSWLPKGLWFYRLFLLPVVVFQRLKVVFLLLKITFTLDRGPRNFQEGSSLEISSLRISFHANFQSNR